MVPILIVGIVIAGGLLFPDTSEFPANPSEQGTFGYIFNSFFRPDGTAKDTARLGGATSDDFLKNKECSLMQVWKGIDAQWNPICVLKPWVLACIGRFSHVTGGVTVQKQDGTTRNANTTDKLCIGETIRTHGGTGTIAFEHDNSIMRLDTNTEVTLNPWALDGRTVAQVIIGDGRLWGRILSATGVNVGNAGIVAGVRGTALNVDTSSVAIIDSQNNDNKLFKRNTNKINSTSWDGGLELIKSDARWWTDAVRSVGDWTVTTRTDRMLEQLIQESNISIQNKNVWQDKTITVTDTWIEDNLKMDIAYLNALKNTVTNPNALEYINKELEQAEPRPDDTSKQQAICGDKQFWKWQTRVENICQKKKNLIAFADYRKGDTNMYTASGQIKNEESRDLKYSYPYNLESKISEIRVTYTGANITSWANVLVSLYKGSTGSGEYYISCQFYDNINEPQVSWSSPSIPTKFILQNKLGNVLTCHTSKYSQVFGTTSPSYINVGFQNIFNGQLTNSFSGTIQRVELYR